MNTTTVKLGSAGELVSEVQFILAANGYWNVPQHGIFDDDTEEAVKLFQLQHVGPDGKQLDSDGQVGKKTWWALRNSSERAQESGRANQPTGGLLPMRVQFLGLLDREHAKRFREEPDGSNRHPEIDKYFRGTGMIGLPWCCAAMSWAMRELSGTAREGTFGDASMELIRARHLGVQNLWVHAKKLELTTETPCPGDLFVQILTKGQGHTGAVIGVADNGDIFTAEGNSGNRFKFGRRARSTINGFIDWIQDGQKQDFQRGSDRYIEAIDGRTR